MLNLKGMGFPIDVILACVRWYVAYPLSYRRLKKFSDAFHDTLVRHLRKLDDERWRSFHAFTLPQHGAAASLRLRDPVQVQLFIKDAQIKFGRPGEHLAASVIRMQ